MRTKHLQQLFFLGLVLAIGCTVYQTPTRPGASPAELSLPSGHRKVYMEEETPAGKVPPPSKSLTAPISPQAAVSPSSQSAISVADTANGTIQRFSKAYADQGCPRIAVLLNRSLSDDVREWQSDTRVTAVQEDRGAIFLTEKTRDKESMITYSNLTATGTVSVDRPADSGARGSPDAEPWLWAFEDGFIKPLLEAEAKIIDRATILRLTATAKSSGALQPIAPKQIEISALKDYADIFVEVLVARSPSAVYGYEFKASAREVNTGVILANVTSARWNSRQRTGRVVVATSEGYKVSNALALPGVQDVAFDLALDLMNSLATNWGQ